MKRPTEQWSVLTTLFKNIWHYSKETLYGVLIATLIINLLSLVFPLVLLQIYDRIIPNNSITTLIILVLIVIASLLINGALRIGRTYLGAWADAKYEHNTSLKAFNQILHGQLQASEKTGAGEQLQQFNSFANIRNFYTGQALITLIDVPFIAVFLLIITYIAGWLVLIPIGLIYILFTVTLGHVKQLQKILHIRKTGDEHRLNFIIETLSNIHTVKSMTMESQMLRRYERLQKACSLEDFKLGLLNANNMSKGGSISQLVMILIASLGSLLIIKSHLTLGSLAACILLSSRCFQPVSTLVNVWTRLQNVKLSNDDMLALLHIPLERENTLPELTHLKGEIQLINVSFRYAKEENYVIKDCNLHIKPKESISLRGDIFSGKTTFFSLLLGFYQADVGEILFDNRNINDYQLTNFREQIAYLSQESILFQGSILDNLTLFNPEKNYANAIRISKEIGLDEIVNSLPQGYNTEVAFQAVETLPQGFLQRILIARALVRDPPIIFFDDANTSLDMKGDELLRKLLLYCSQSKTLIITSHRPSIRSVAKKHYILKNGILRLDEKL